MPTSVPRLLSLLQALGGANSDAWKKLTTDGDHPTGRVAKFRAHQLHSFVGYGDPVDAFYSYFKETTADYPRLQARLLQALAPPFCYQ